MNWLDSLIGRVFCVPQWYCSWCGEEMHFLDTPWLGRKGIGHVKCDPFWKEQGLS